MKLLPYLVCLLKGHRVEHAYYSGVQSFEFGFMHYGIEAKCSRCEKTLEEDECSELPILMPPAFHDTIQGWIKPDK